MYERRAETFAPPAPPANQNAAPTRVSPLPLDRLQHPRLRAALQAWDELTERSGCYDRGRRGFGPLLAKPELMNDRSSVIVCEGDDPLDYLFAYYGGGFGLYRDKNFVAQRLRDIPDQDALEAVVAAYRGVIESRQPAAHRVQASFGGVAVTYDRLILPTVGEDGQVDRLITLSVELERQVESAPEQLPPLRA
jgi:hypothetical protein